LDYPISHAERSSICRLVRKFTRYDASTVVKDKHSGNALAELRASSIRFFATKPLDRHEGLAFTLDFAKGAITPPDRVQQLLYTARDNTITTSAVLGLLALGVYYFAAWVLFGREPPRGAIVPLFRAAEESVGRFHALTFAAWDMTENASSRLSSA